MAGNQVNVNLSVTDQGNTLKQRNREAKELNETLTSAAKSARNAMAPQARLRGEGTEYGRARGTVGSTGAEARDFANQAQGLGGLVRVYATVAANLFAATAAFNALKEAANTSLMVEGLNQLGAASGVALGSLSKQFAAATDNAISLREAMGSVAKATAAGLSSTQVLEIGKYAKTASQALGVDMTDAVNRLTRGIVKLEPELLDELGLFTKIGPATEKYARDLGKTAGSLTDFERRQAFANAVLQEARDKFGGLQLDANPYQKLEASIRNLATAGLELINKFLTPLANLLANNSTLLIAALGAVSLKLLNMAIPALRGWRNELVETAQLAQKQSRSILESFGTKFAERTEAKLKIPSLQQDLQAAQREYAAASKAFIETDNNYRRKGQSGIIKALEQEQDLSDKIKNIRREITARTKEGGDANIRHAESLTKLLSTYEKMAEAKKKLTAAETAAETAYGTSSAEESARLRILRNASARAERLNVLSQVGGNVESGGFRYAMDMLKKGVDEAANMSAWDKLSTRILGTFSAGIAQLGIFLRALSGIGTAIATVGVGIAILNSIFSKNQDQQQAFTTDITRNKDVVDTAARTVKMYGDAINTASLAARGTAFQELGISVDNLVFSFSAAIEKASWLDNALDAIFEKIPGMKSLGQDFAQSIGKNIEQQVKMIDEGPARQAFEEKIKAILTIESVSSSAIEKALNTKDDKQRIETAKELNKAAEAARAAQKASGEQAKSYAESLKTVNLRAGELIQSLYNTDPVTKFGDSLIEMGIKLQTASKDTKESIAAIKEIIKDPKGLSLVSPDSLIALKGFEANLDKIKVNREEAKKELETAQAQVDALQQRIEQIAPKARTGSEAAQSRLAVLGKELASAQGKVTQLTGDLIITDSDTNKIRDAMGKLAVEAITKGYEVMNRLSGIAMQQGALNVQRAILKGLSGPSIIQAQANLDRQDIQLQRQQLSITQKLVETMELSNALQEERLTMEKTQQIYQTATRENRPVTDQEGQELGRLEMRRAGYEALRLGRLTQRNMPDDPGVQLAFKRMQLVKQGTRTQEEALKQRERVINTTEQIDLAGSLLDRTQQLQSIEDARRNTLLSISNLQYEGLEYLTQQQLQAKQQNDSEAFALQQIQQTLGIRKEIADIESRLQLKNVDEKQRTALQQLLAETKNRLKTTEDQQAAELKLFEVKQKQAEINNTLAQQAKQAEFAAKKQELSNQIQLDSIENALQLLPLRAQLTAITGDDIAKEEKRLKLEQLTLQTKVARTAIEVRLAADLAKISAEQNVAAAAAAAAGEAFDPTVFETRKKQIQEVGALELSIIERNNQAKLQALDLQFSMTTRMQAYDEMFRKSIDNMADAMIEFTKTGKLNYKDMINSMLQDLLRFELRQQYLKAYSNIGGISGIFDAFARATSKYSPMDTELGFANFTQSAKGNVFGAERFAKGGMFTNKIVSQPTLFKFAQGTGLMGEAGPEAIMPLKRDSSGTLGVRSTQPRVDVVVNNYSTQVAETRETVDSRGNRKIEVVIGDMVAGELGRKNSPLQQSMQQNFQAKPSVVRR